MLELIIISTTRYSTHDYTGLKAVPLGDESHAHAQGEKHTAKGTQNETYKILL